MALSEEKDARFYCAWEAEAFLGDIETAAENIVSLTQKARNVIKTSVSPCDEEEPFFPAADCREYLLAVEKGLYEMSQAVSLLAKETVETSPKERSRYNKKKQTETSTIKLIQQVDLIVFKTPYLRKSLKANMNSMLPLSPLGNTVFTINPELFTAKRIDMYVLSVYPTGTAKERIIDADNINVKAFGDPITQMLEIDDNGIDVCLHVYASIDDELDGGTYMVIVPQRDEKLGPAKLTSIIKNSEKPT